WAGGTLSGTGVTNAGGGMQITGSGHTLNARTLNNGGGATLQGPNSTVTMGNGAVLNNQSGATLDIQNDNGFTFNNVLAATINNDGMFQRPLGSGVADVNGVTFNNSAAGVVDVQSGTLNLSGGGASAGTFMASGGTLQFGGGTHTLSTTATVTGANVTF